MSTRSEESKARIERQRAAPPSEDQPKRNPLATGEAKLVRRSVSLSPTHHARLTQWCHETAVQIGGTRVTRQDVFRALVARLLTDETVARKIRADIADIIESS
ncbi:MAG: hypothetical protein QOI10_3514 [Solirubrobacterales bacterium]|jgi:hypothetical protein|nr:hypothetical protein [Solirubrobacterales bacterium]